MPSDRPADVPPRATPQRRLLSIVFCDLVGSTELSAGLDPEDLLEVMRRYHDCCAGVIRGAGGYVARVLGDGVLSYFGYPRAREDDAVQAVGAALDLFDALAAVNIGIERKLQIRVGIASGTVIVGDLFGAAAGERDVIGETANLAARLQTAAEPGQVVICAATRDLTRGHFRYRALEPLTLKGFAAPVAAWHVLGRVRVASRFAAQRSRAAAPLIGRRAEAEGLWQSWRGACTEAGRVVLLRGEPGIGKSRLSEALIARLEGEAHLRLRLFCSPYHTSSALFPFVNHIERVAGFEHADPPQRKLEKLKGLLAGSPAGAEPALSVLGDLMSLPADGGVAPAETARERRERVFTAIVDQIAWMARRNPVLVLMEDLHWADPTSQELLSRIIDEAPRWRVLVLLTARPEYTPPWGERADVTTIALSGLGRSDAAMIAIEVAGGRSLPPEVLEPILRRTEGVPLFIEEMTKAMLESGLLRADSGRYVLAAPLPAMAIPTNLAASLQARLDRLGPAIEIAQAGAVLGRQFSYAMMRSVSNRTDAELQSALARLAEAQIIHCDGEPPDAEYRFNHSLLQDVAYSMMLRPRRQHLHERIVEVLEAGFPETAERAPELLAMHSTAAGLTGKAVDYWMKAGSRAVTRSANREAIDHLTKGLAVLAQLPDGAGRARTELTMRLMLAHASIAVNGYGSEVTAGAYARAGELIEFGTLDERAGALFGMYIGHLMGGRLESGTPPLRRLLALAEEHRHSGYLCLAHRVLGVLALYRGECAAACSHLETAIGLYDHSQHQGLTFRFGSHVAISAQAWLSVALWLAGLPDRARRTADEAVAAARDFAHAHTLGHVFGLVTHVYAMDEDFPTLAAISAEGEAFCERHRLGFFGPWLSIMGLWAGAQTGDPAAAIAPMRDALARYEATNTTLMRDYFRALLVRLLLIAGRPDEATAEVETALRHIDETGANWWKPEVLGLRAETLLAASPPQRAAAELCLHQALDEARTGGSKMLELRLATRIARLLRADGQAEAAERLLAPLLGAFTEGVTAPDLRSARALLAMPH